MFRIREHSFASSAARQRALWPVVEITARGDNLPLLASENWTDRWCTLQQDFAKVYKDFYEFQVKSDDVFVVTFPKCGTTWMQEAAWLLMNNLDFETAKSVPLCSRSVFLDLTPIDYAVSLNTIELVASMKSPRLIKTHFPAHLLPRQIWDKKVKIIYCGRNPKDVVVSYYHFLKGFNSWRGDMHEFIDDFINEDIKYTPFWSRVLDFWQMRHEPNVFFTTYEEMKRDLASVLRSMCTFLERPALSVLEMEKLVEHLSFQNMKENRSANPTERIKSTNGLRLPLSEFQFMRRGIVGAYADELTVDNQRRLDQWTEKCLKRYNITEQDIFGTV